MGEVGLFSRVLSLAWGAPFTYASLGASVAPGQVTLEDLLELYRAPSLTSETRVFGLVGNPLYRYYYGDVERVTTPGTHRVRFDFRTRNNREWITSGGAGTMGFGFPSAIGAQFGRPNAEVWAVVGDGGFQMTLCELATAAVNKLPVRVLIINNNYLGMVRQWQELFFANRLSGVDLEGNPDFVKLAEAYGVKAFRIKRSADVDRILQQAHDYDEGPCVVVAEVVKEDNVFPMIPAGASVAEMLVEKPKEKLAKPEGST